MILDPNLPRREGITNWHKAVMYWVCPWVAIAGILIYVWIAMYGMLRQAPQSYRWDTVAKIARSLPITGSPVPARGGLALNNSELEQLSELMHPSLYETITLSHLLHLLRLHGCDYLSQIPNTDIEASLIDILTHDELGRKALGASPLGVTDYGIRYWMVQPFGQSTSEWRSAESHRDQFLATMAESGVSLEQEIVVGGVFFSVRDVLKDSLAQFRLRQDELAWTALAYAAYLPPTGSWTNRFDETYSFDDVASELLNRSLSDSSCCGVHIVFALNAILHADDSSGPIISATVRRKIDLQLRSWLQIAIKTQLQDGSWPPEWWNAEMGLAEFERNHIAWSTAQRLLVTSHLVEWLYALNEDFDVPDQTMRLAASWLTYRIRQATPNELRHQFCGYSHACSALKLALSAGNCSKQRVSDIRSSAVTANVELYDL